MLVRGRVYEEADVAAEGGGRELAASEFQAIPAGNGSAAPLPFPAARPLAVPQEEEPWL